ncbi:MAG: asparagine synthase (glutamine-hydrolyzing) [Candidatus Nitrospinota bacterium M3_3B_026]
MCGIAGFVTSRPGASKEELERTARAMADAITYRGPDDGGTWADEAAGVALSHRRLAIIDLSSHGRQPMVSASGRYVIAYNGEVYNFPDIRKELEKDGSVEWRGHSDTEVILAAVERWGIEKSLGKFNGMFAFALWDKRERTLTLARDRLGKKPLYYGVSGGVFMFASELKALMAHPAFEGETDKNSLAMYMRHNYVPSPYSIYKNIRKLPPASFATLSLSGGAVTEPRVEEYWSAREVYELGTQSPLFDGDEEAAADELEKLLLDAVKIRMISDVPLGAFLSGGVDSSLVVALMKEVAERPVRTFTIGFHEEGYNEAEYAKAVAQSFQTNHTELYLTSADAREVIPSLPEMYDEPFADSSQIPTFLVSRMARESVTVCLSGDGGDESFGGYNRYLWALSIWRAVRLAPRPLRKLFAGAIGAMRPPALEAAFGTISPALPSRLQVANPADKAYKLAEILALSGPMEIYRWLVSQFKNPALVVPGSAEYRSILDKTAGQLGAMDFITRMMLLDTVTYLPDDILTKVDRASMAVSLEARAPLVDHRVVEFAARLPVHMKVKGGVGKLPLRRLLYRRVPRELIERPKMGFGLPIGEWLRGPLRGWGEALLDEGRLRREGFFDPALLRRMWAEHLEGRRNWQYQLWTVLMFQAWHERFHGTG